MFLHPGVRWRKYLLCVCSWMKTSKFKVRTSLSSGQASEYVSEYRESDEKTWRKRVTVKKDKKVGYRGVKQRNCCT